MKQSTSKPRIVSKAQAAQDVFPFVSQPEHVLPLLCLLAQAQLSNEDLLGQIAKPRPVPTVGAASTRLMAPLPSFCLRHDYDPAGLQRYLQLRQDAVNDLAQQIFAVHGSVYAPWGPCGRDSCREDLGFHLEFLRPVLEFGLVQPMVSYLMWLRVVLGVRGITTDHLAQSLHGLGDFYAAHLDPPDATALRAQIDAMLQVLALATSLGPKPKRLSKLCSMGNTRPLSECFILRVLQCELR